MKPHIILLGILFAFVLTIHATEEPVRQFTDSKGRTITASLVRATGDDVWLRIEKEVKKVSVRTLSKADRAYVALHLEHDGVKKGVQGGDFSQGGKIPKEIVAKLDSFSPVPNVKETYACWWGTRLIIVDSLAGGPYQASDIVQCKLIPKNPLIHSVYDLPFFSAVDIKPEKS